MKNHINIILAVFGCFFCLLSHSQIQFFGKPENISNLNTPDGENYLVLNPHAKGLAFTKERKKSDSATYDQIFYNVFDSTWEATIFLDHGNEVYSPLGFDESGSILFNKVIYDKGVYRGMVMMFPSGSEEGVEVNIPFLSSKSSVQNGCLSQDGRYMILSMESNNTYGVEDLYLMKKKGDGWSSPINIGSQINTEFQEVTPFLAADNRTLFFATNGRDGEGSFDIFYSVRQDESWRNWSLPINIGKPVNTSGAETSFSFLDDDEWAYYVSSQNSDGYGDIKRIKIKEDIEEDTTSVEQPVAIEEVHADILLKVIDKQTRETIPSVLIVSDTPIILPNGIFMIDSSFMLNNEVEIKAKGYLPSIVALDTTLIIGTNEVEMESIEVGNTITLNNVLFKRGTAEMLGDSEKELNLVVEMMNDNPDVKILLKGHTDNQGDPVLNVKLSEARVKSVREYLLSKGINAYRITGKGFGGNDPIASNETEATRKLNRRVEFEVVED